MLILTSGDPYSVNVELFLKSGLPVDPRWPTLVIGCAWQWCDQAMRLGLPMPAFEKVSSPAVAQSGVLSFLEVGDQSFAVPAETLSSSARGDLAVRALRAVPQDTTAGSLAVVTGPIDKHACHGAGFSYPGQTEFFEDLWQGQAVMTLAGPLLRVGLVTNHLALRDVPQALTIATVTAKLELFIKTLREAFGKSSPRIAVSGLNPHASDQGLFGDEEARVLKPAIDMVRHTCPDAVIVGPLPADTAFYRAYQGAYDGVLAMYHDQGLGPLKTVHFDDAINLSGGLRHLRVSPDHGPAKDLFLSGKASMLSVQAAVQTAKQYLTHRESV
jgi:4-hydroxythreonine-4-phosphate dehydrogenase